TCGDWRTFTKDHNLEVSMSRRGNCHDNAVAESFFNRRHSNNEGLSPVEFEKEYFRKLASD
ncbi:MAG: IS3 family transposase, partial [Gammaproteobacteria bacterium]|nr:IS3 family transposase [Gammaproteobacteria bacterium]